eukprot:4376575-Prymnesium_polylepis.1
MGTPSIVASGGSGAGCSSPETACMKTARMSPAGARRVARSHATAARGCSGAGGDARIEAQRRSAAFARWSCRACVCGRAHAGLWAGSTHVPCWCFAAAGAVRRVSWARARLGKRRSSCVRPPARRRACTRPRGAMAAAARLCGGAAAALRRAQLTACAASCVLAGA